MTELECIVSKKTQTTSCPYSKCIQVQYKEVKKKDEKIKEAYMPVGKLEIDLNDFWLVIKILYKGTPLYK